MNQIDTELDRLVERYHQDLLKLDIPSFYDPSSSATHYNSDTPVSPLITKLKLSKIDEDLTNIRAAYSDNDYASKVVAPVRSLLDEKIYINHEIILQWQHTQDTNKDAQGITHADGQSQDPYASTSTQFSSIPNTTSPLADDNLSSLRKRLLSTSNNHLLDKSNDYHDSIQEDILTELTGFAQTLKDSALRLSSKIVDDATVLEKTNENLLKNSDLMGIIDKNLNNYVLNKTGGKISFWFLIKVLLAVFALFFVMVLVIKIFPKF
ncbi:hypothetical protein CAAN1_27S00760 [[Candida] anglica]|uniref:Protein transport protein USE1 n=1 Tax=[Candida] anglica TaxID=148631 RepID=A0ABP0E9K0_9ASCO